MNNRYPLRGAPMRASLIALSIFVLFIFCNSMIPLFQSLRESGKVVSLLQSVLDTFHIPLTVSSLFVRKAAHVVEYLILGVLLTYAFARGAHALNGERIYRVLFLGLLIPVVDETVQLFANGRSSQVSDILLDFGSVIVGVVLVGLMRSLRQRRKPLKYKRYRIYTKQPYIR